MCYIKELDLMGNKRTGKRKIFLIILIAALLIGLFALILHLIEKNGLLDEQFGDSGAWGSDDEGVELDFSDKSYRSDDIVDTYLIIGTDAGGEDYGEAYKGELADFLTLLVVDNTTQKYGFIQIDRNTMTDVQVLDDNGEFSDYFKEQICLSHWYGTDEEQRNLNTLQAVSGLFGYLEIDNYYTINMADMDVINNALGGVVVDIETDMTDIDPEFVKGNSVLLKDGQAEKFVRARMGVGEGTNKERMARQTQYMQKAYSMVMGQLRENPEYINDIYDALRDKVQAGEYDSNISRMTNQLIQYESLGIMQISGKSVTNDTQDDGKEHEEFYADESSILAALKSIIDLEEVTE